MANIKFQTPLYKLLDVQVRKKGGKLIDGEEPLYAVLRISSIEQFDNFRLKKRPERQQKNITMICFTRHLWKMISPENLYVFKGFVSFAYGSTFLVVETIINALGQDLFDIPVDDKDLKDEENYEE